MYYQDTSAFHVVTLASLDDLNTRLDTPVNMARFRPNVVVSGTKEPFAEDAWLAVKVGDAVVRNIKPSERSVLRERERVLIL